MEKIKNRNPEDEIEKIFIDSGKILVIKLRHIGDVLLTAPVFRALRETFPDAGITALVNSGTEDMLKGNPLIDEVITYDRDIKKLSPVRRYLKETAFLRGLRKKGYAMTVDLTGGDRAAVISLLSGAKYRLGWKQKKGLPGKTFFYTHLAEPDHHKHTVLQNLDVLKSFGITTDNLAVDLPIAEADRAFAEDIVRNIRKTTDTEIIHVHPTSRWLFKCWKDEHMAEVINWLLSEGRAVIVTASPGPKEMDRVKKIISLVGPSPRLIDLSGTTTLKQLGAISEKADLFFGVDSAPMHMAAAAGTPVVALFGPSGAFHWGPWDNGLNELKRYEGRGGVRRSGIHTVIQRDWECVPCGKDGCRGSKKSRCLDEITPDEVKKILSEKLNIC